MRVYPQVRATCPRFPGVQSGLITLITCLLLLILSTLVSLNLSKAIWMAQKATSNELRASQAFEAAEAGLNSAKSFLAKDPDVDGNGEIDPVFDTNADGLGDTHTHAFGNSSATVSIFDSVGDMSHFQIVSRGQSDDQSTTRTISQSVAFSTPLPYIPNLPLTVSGDLAIESSAVVLNPEGFSTIWSGGTSGLGSDSRTRTGILDQGEEHYPECLDTLTTCRTILASTPHSPSVDVLSNDSSLAALDSDNLFQNYLGMRLSTYRQAMVSVDATASRVSELANLATHEVIFSEGNVSINGITVGCSMPLYGSMACPPMLIKPSIIIICGNANITGNMHLYGALFVTGDITFIGSTTIDGAVVVGGNATSENGNLSITYNSRVLLATHKAGPLMNIPSSWKDF